MSSSLEQTPVPPTPPMYDDDVYTLQYDRDLPLDYYDSPPSPPRTLQDQMQAAYAHDNMHLAKILLLKLKGIEVTDDRDPRIAQVQDEDFSETFVPRGGLRLSEEGERRCREGQRRELERRRRKAREERLKVCEKVWEAGARKYQEAKAQAARKKEADSRVRRLAHLEARERDRERARERESAHDPIRHRRAMRNTCGVPRPILSYDSLPALHSRDQMSTSRSPQKEDSNNAPLYTYPIMRPTSPPVLNPQSHSKPASPNSAYRELTALSATAVPFSDVMSSLQGPLFPEDDNDQYRRGKSLTEMKLLETLLEPITWELRVREDDRLTKGKSRIGVKDECAACSSEFNSEVELSVSSSSSTTVTRSVSWFSFGSRSSSSTAATTPSTSPMSTKYVPTMQPSKRDPSRPVSIQHSCRRPCLVRSSSVPLGSSENPLCCGSTKSSSSLQESLTIDGCTLGRGRPLGRITNASRIRSSSVDSTMFSTGMGIVARMTRSVTSFMDMAAQLQRAYVKATMYTASPDIYFASSSSCSRSRSRSSSRARSRTRSGTGGVRRRDRGALRPQGYRASSDDVLTFTSPDQSSAAPTPERPLIPLSTPRSSTSPLQDVPRVFPTPPPVPRSPFRPAQPPLTLTSRLRPVANPLLLRLRALQNVYGAENDVLEVREKVVGVAWEGIGRSGLVREVKLALSSSSP